MISNHSQLFIDVNRHISPFGSLHVSETNLVLIASFFPSGCESFRVGYSFRRKVAHLCLEGLGKIKVALASSDTLSLLKVLEGAFGHIDSDMSDNTPSVSVDIPVQKPTDTEKVSEVEPPEKVPIVPPGESSLATAELAFPLKSISPIISGIPELLLPLCGSETLSRYKCQHPSCNQEFLQKAAACNHVCHDHLHVALACLYCSADNSSKMHW